MDSITLIKQELYLALSKIGHQISTDEIIIEQSKDAAHGDFATNVAMQLNRTLRKNPRHIAAEIVAHIDQSRFERIEVAGPGFINFFMKAESLAGIIAKIINQGESYGSSLVGQGISVNVEFVSANPTGALHLGHARGAALGDVIARLLSKAGYQVTKEFYVNDAGAQINNLAQSIYARYVQLFDQVAELPQDGYHGEDIKNIAADIKKEVGDFYLGHYDEAFFKAEGIKRELAIIKDDLSFFRVEFDKFSYETSIRTPESIDRVFIRLAPHIYEHEGATFLKTTEYGDDKDRVIVKSDGTFTYFLPDIAYHLDKIERGHRHLIDILGADHHGYISRMKAALAMLGHPLDTLDIEILQMVRLIKDGQEMKMSKRTGVGVTLRELCQEVGVDAARYFFVARAASSHLDFDLDLAVSASSANPVYYAQYAHARLSSLLEAGAEIGFDDSGVGLDTIEEKQLLRHLESFEAEVVEAANARAPYKITNYVQKLASLTHSFYTICRVVDKENISLSKSRLALVRASRIVMANALALLGVSAPVKM
ncbi:MAG TPA: arginine--tRNA ligase [Bacilli bacterium]|nr:arginine--tRNA ligase [Bacilli bacterium]